MDTRTLHHMYQAWIQGKDELYQDHWYDFVEFVSRQQGTTGDNVMRILQTCQWYRKGEQ
jgi:hypothetical protein